MCKSLKICFHVASVSCACWNRQGGTGSVDEGPCFTAAVVDHHADVSAVMINVYDPI